MKLWDKGKQIMEPKIDQFTAGNDRILDKRLAPYDIDASIAHARMLSEVALLNQEEADELIALLKDLRKIVIQPEFEISEEFEDIHSYLEYYLTEKLGEAGKKIHAARSRNDQVLTALHLYIKEALTQLIEKISALSKVLLVKAEASQNLFMPGYTHMQIAMPSSFGLWFSAWTELFVDDLILLNTAIKLADQNPLGSAAGYGSSFPIDRQKTTDYLNFRTLRINSIAAQLSRGKLELTTAFALASTASTLGKMVGDIVLYSGGNFGFFALPDEFTTGSSIMPHKKNPDIFELIRGRCNRIQSLPGQIQMLITNLPSGYHRDFQLLKEPLFEAIDSLFACLEMTLHVVPEIKAKPVNIRDMRYAHIDSVDRVAQLVQKGKSFRDAYRIIGEMIESDRYPKQRISVKTTHLGSVGNPGISEIREKLKKEVGD